MDAVDGNIARTTRNVTYYGKFLDGLLGEIIEGSYKRDLEDEDIGLRQGGYERTISEFELKWLRVRFGMDIENKVSVNIYGEDYPFESDTFYFDTLDGAMVYAQSEVNKILLEE